MMMDSLRKVFIRSAYNYDVDEASNETALVCEGLSRTKQSFKEECDINEIVRRFGITGQLPSDVRMPTYGDYDGVVDYKTAMDALALARESFEQMPANVRTRFDNDPSKFVDFCSDDRNIEEARKLGLIPAAEMPPGAPEKPVVAPAGPSA